MSTGALGDRDRYFVMEVYGLFFSLGCTNHILPIVALRLTDHFLSNEADTSIFYFLVFRTTKSKKTPQLNLKDFHQFLNSQQRDPRLNEILHPLTSKDQASKIIAKYEGGKSGQREREGERERERERRREGERELISRI